MKRFLLILLIFSVLPSITLAADKFGQEVSEGLEKLVVDARKKRLPYIDGYDPEASVTILNEVLISKPDYYRAYYNLGLAHHELEDYNQSKKSFDKALEIHESQNIKDNTIFNTAGWVSLKNNDLKRAEELLKKAELLTKGDGSFTERAVHSNLGELYFLTQKFELSKDYFIISRDKYKSSTAGDYLKLIEEIQKKINTIE